MALIRSHLLKYIVASVRRLLQLLRSPAPDRRAVAYEADYLRLAIQYGPANLCVEGGAISRWKVANPEKSNLGDAGNIVLAWDDPDLAACLGKVVKVAVTIAGRLKSPAAIADTVQVLELFLQSARATAKKSATAPQRAKPGRPPRPAGTDGKRGRTRRKE